MMSYAPLSFFGGAPTQILTFCAHTYVCTYVRPKLLYLHCMRQNVLNFNVKDSQGCTQDFLLGGGRIAGNPISRQLYALPEAAPMFWELLR